MDSDPYNCAYILEWNKRVGDKAPKNKVKRAESGTLCYIFSTLYYVNVLRILKYMTGGEFMTQNKE